MDRESFNSIGDVINEVMDNLEAKKVSAKKWKEEHPEEYEKWNVSRLEAQKANEEVVKNRSASQRIYSNDKVTDFNELKSFSLSELVSMTFPESKWLVDGLISEGGIN